PKPDQYVAVDTVVRPVTHTAETAVKSASTNGARSPVCVAAGSESRAATTATIPAKTSSASRAGDWRARWSTTSRSPPSSLWGHRPAVVTLTGTPCQNPGRATVKHAQAPAPVERGPPGVRLRGGSSHGTAPPGPHP